MKNFIYLLSFIFLTLASCEPLEDVYEELDAQGEETVEVIGTDDYTLIEEDYKDILGLTFANFNSNDDAKRLISDVLLERYPQLTAGSSINATYNLFNPIEKTVYTVTAADYTAVSLDKLVTEDDFNAFFNYKFPGTEKGDIVELTYKTDPTINEYTLTDADYASVGNGRFNNFDIRAGSAEETIESRRIKIETILLNNNPGAVLGTKFEVTYATFNGSTGTDTMLVELGENTSPTTTVDYTLVNADYALVGNGRFNNFDIRDGRDEETVEARRVKIETILLNNFPTSVAGDFYNVTYATFDGSTGTDTMLVTFNGTNWNIFNTLTYKLYTFGPVDKTSRFTFINDWKAPFVLMADDYRALNQRFDNFDGRSDDGKNEAVRLMEIYLKSKYPFAKEGDFVAVEYNLFEGSAGTTVNNKNFTFDGVNWNGIANVVERTLQFGFNGTVWEPDNTIRYTLTNADYALVGNDRFNNFDVRAGRDEETIEARLAKINTILLNNFPSLGEGQKFVVIYDVWIGSDAVYETKVIKDGSEYVLNE